MELLNKLRCRWSAVLGKAAERSSQADEYRASIAEWEGRDGMSDVVELLRGKIVELGSPSSDEVEAKVFLAGAAIAESLGGVEELGNPDDAVTIAIAGGVAYFPTAAAADEWRKTALGRGTARTPAEELQKPAGRSKKGRLSEIDRRKIIGFLGKGTSVEDVSHKVRRSVETVRHIAGDAGIKLKTCEVCNAELSSAFFEERPGAHNLDDGLSRACKSCIKAHKDVKSGEEAEPPAERTMTALAAAPSIDPAMAAVLESCGIECVEDLLSLSEGLAKSELSEALRELDVPMGTAIHVAALVTDGTIEKEIGGKDGQA